MYQRQSRANWKRYRNSLHLLLPRAGQGGLEVLKSADMAEKGKGWLIVDDLVDTGETAKALRQMMPDAHFATVYAKPAGRPLVDTFVTEVSQDTWIFFPWDMEPQPSTPIIGLRG